MNILIIKLSALGDVVQAVPVFEALRQRYPTARISWVVDEEVAELLQHYPGLDGVLVCRRRLWAKRLREPPAWPVLAMEVLGFCRQLRRRHYDVVIDLQGLLKSGLLLGVTRGGRKLGFDRTREGSWLFLNEKLQPYDPDRHAVERYLDVAGYLGAEVSSVRFQDPWTAEEQPSFASRLEQITAGSKGPLIVCHPIGRWPTKLWPADRFARLTRRLAEEVEATVVFTGSARDRGRIQAIVQQGANDRLLNRAGATSLRELAYLYKHAALLVAVDSGPMHLAAALGTPVVALFGPTAPWRTGPYGSGHAILWAGLDCSPCFKRECQSGECMAAISVDEVMRAVLDQLRKGVGDGYQQGAA
jgi:lipopolysaccharide heptosyltransferase I